MKNNIRILHLIDTTGRGGAEKVFLHIIENLDTNFKSFVILPDKGWLYKKATQLPNVNVYIINGRGRFNLLYIYRLIKFVLINKIDVIQAHLFGTSLYASLIGTLCSKPVVSTFHGFIDADSRDPLLKIKFLIIKAGSKKIVSVSEHLNGYVRSIIGRRADKCITIYNGTPLPEGKITIDRPHEKQLLKLSDKDIVIGSVGNIKPAKGYTYLIKAAKLITNANARCKFIIAGTTKDPLYEDLLKLREELSLQQSINFIGYQEDTSKLYALMDIFVLPSVSEGFSLVTIEAMAQGIPVIVTESGGPQEIVENNFSGLTVKPKDEHALAKAISYYLNNPAAQKKHSQNAKATVRTRFSLDSMTSAYENLYHNLITN